MLSKGGKDGIPWKYQLCIGHLIGLNSRIGSAMAVSQVR